MAERIIELRDISKSYGQVYALGGVNLSVDRGEVVGCFDTNGAEIARGLVNYTAQETARILRRPSSEIESILGYVDEPELIHRDNLVLLR